jgi:hypothetical protein
VPVKKDVRELGRRKVRYRLYRIQSGDLVDSNDGLKAHFESQDEFDGWHNFGVTWDTGDEGEWPEGHFLAVPLEESLEAQWQKTVLGLVKDFPTDESEES